MASKRKAMRQVREVLRLNSLGHSPRKIARSLGMGRTTVRDYLRRAQAAGLSWPLPDDLEDRNIEQMLFFKPEEARNDRPIPDWKEINIELRKYKHVTLALLWQEYKAQHPEGYQYTQFCEHYRRWEGTLKVWMRQVHRGGEKLFVDFSGDGIPWIDPLTGEEKKAHLFVAVLGASNYIYAEATRTQQLPDWINCHVHAYEFLSGVTRLTIPDQCRTAVKKTCRYDPVLNPTYQEMANHYDTCVLPARPGRPRDKAKVEVGVLIAQRWIIAALRKEKFFSIKEINEAILKLLEKLNNRPIKKLGQSRWELFNEIDKPKLIPLPEKAYEFAAWKIGLRVNVDYHVEFEKNYYSAPYQLVHKKVDLRATARTVEIFHRQTRVASHLRSYGRCQHVTVKEHMPRSHREHAEWTPSRITNWARENGPATAELVEGIMNSRQLPEHGYRACLGVLRLAKQYTAPRLEKACARALACKSYSYRSVESILKNKLEEQPLPSRTIVALPTHENIRGSVYYQ